MTDVRRRNASPQQAGSRDLKDWVGAEKAEQITHIFDRVYPIFHFVGGIFNVVFPYLLLAWSKANALWIALQPYQPLELTSVLMGFFMAFFGSRYLLLLAAIEAARQSGYKGFKDNLWIIYENFEKIYRQNLLDNAVDADGNGKADVDELSRKDLFTRKFKLFLRVTDPDVVVSAFTGLWVAFLGIVATLRVQFAQTIALGVSIGRVIEGPLNKFVAPVISSGIKSEYRQWVPFCMKQLSSFIGCTLAFLVARALGGFYSAIKGGQMFAMGLIAYLVKHSYISNAHSDQGIMYSGLVAVIFVTGLYFQISTFFSLPFPLNILLLPASLAENVLLYFVSSNVNTGAMQ